MSELLETLVIAAVVALSLRRGLFLVAALLRGTSWPHSSVLPSVTVVVPARNERTVAERMLRALGTLRYSGDLSFILVSDGCSDETPNIFRAWAAARSDARVLELPVSRGKAAALNAALPLTGSALVVALDADLAAMPDFLSELVRPFADPAVAAAAAFLRPANADENIVTRYAAVTTWVHQLVTSAGTDRLGLNPPTLGAAAFRRSALADIGGFAEVSTGEDVATSARLTRAGWRTRFVSTAVIDNIVVSDVRDFWRQHVRWSRAVFRAHSPAQPSRASFAQRVESAAASIGYADRLVFAVAVLGTLAGVLPSWIALLYLSVPGLEIVAALLKAGVRGAVPRFLVATALLFVADLCASLVAVVVHAAQRPYEWHSPRWRHVEGDAEA